jgi:hypothetical protein
MIDGSLAESKYAGWFGLYSSMTSSQGNVYPNKLYLYPGLDTEIIVANFNSFIEYKGFDLQSFNEREFGDRTDQYLQLPLTINDIVSMNEHIFKLIGNQGELKMTDIEIELIFSNRPFDWTKGE